MNVRDYAVVTGGYWAFTVTDGALRMLVLLYFNQLGYSPVALAFLFLLYELMGVVTNLVGGWVGSRTGLHRTLVAGLALQVVALLALTAPSASWAEWAAVAYVTGFQALSGVAKDLTKTSSKSAVKHVAGDGDGALFRLVAILTGSKNALKGVGFFVGGGLLAWIGYDAALVALAALVATALVVVLALLRADIGRSKERAPLRSVLSSSTAINRLAAARVLLFASRDIWFVVALPVFLEDDLGWSSSGIGGFLAAWVIGYGAIQSVAPRLLRGRVGPAGTRARDEAHAARSWALALAVVSGLISLAVATGVGGDAGTTLAIVGGLVVFGAVFALNSSLHSYLILAYAADDRVSIDVGFYYSANAVGRLVGTLLSGVLYLVGGLALALAGSSLAVVATWLLSRRLPPVDAGPTVGVGGAGVSAATRPA